MSRGLYLDLRKVAAAPCDRGVGIRRESRLHTVYRTLEHLGWMHRVDDSDEVIWWTLSGYGWARWSELERNEQKQEEAIAEMRGAIRRKLAIEAARPAHAGDCGLCTTVDGSPSIDCGLRFDETCACACHRAGSHEE